MFYIKENEAVPRSLFGKAKNFLESENFPWYYVGATAYTGKNAKSVETLYNGSFYHIAYDHKKNSQVSDVLEHCLLCCLDNLNIKMNNLIRIRIGMIPVCPYNFQNPPHVDFTFPHKVGLLYMNDSDGDTVIYNEKHDLDPLNDSLRYLQNTLKYNLTVKEKITPQENKFVLFDGSHYHSSSTPTTVKRRIAVNYVFD